MPTPYDLLSEKLDDPTDPDDQLRLMLGQDQGANLAGAPQAQPDGQPDTGPPQAPGAQPVAPSPNVPGPLAALAAKPVKPKIKLKPPRPSAKPHLKLKLKPKPKPHIKLKLSGGLDGVRP